MYYDFSEQVNRIPGHRVLAIDRGEREGFLKAVVEANKEEAVGIILKEVITADNACSEAVRSAAEDSYDRLIFPSLEREIRSQLTENADEQAIKVFSLNLRQLLMQPAGQGERDAGAGPCIPYRL